MTAPIAVLDTGAGGLSVVAAIKNLLPHEDIHYFADTANLPYGIKSPELIQYLALKMARKLFDLSSCKMLVIACHTISVWYQKELQQELGIPVVGMVEPSISALKVLMDMQNLSSIGVLSTKATLHSGAYRRAFSALDPQAKMSLFEKACGPLVSLVEDSDINEEELSAILANVLPQELKTCDALLIGCTHFSALKKQLKHVVNPDCHIVDSAYMVAQHVKEMLDGAEALEKPGQLQVYVSDNVQRFANVARRFIEQDFPITLVKDYATS